MSLSPVEIEQLAEVLAADLAIRLQKQVDPDALMDVHGAAEFLACSVPTIERLTKGGDLPSVKIGRLRRYRRGDLIEKLKGGADHGE
ncbi:MAG: helix-turn-helix domain-containing protein [bacterium]|nr:helix-turn-helix domain-containing protein [bacterium]